MYYFQNFPITPYYFGKELRPTAFQNLNAYVDIVDQIKDNLDFYVYTYIQDERPDQLSHILYGDHTHYWTFWLMNDHIRRSGWPLSDSELKARLLKHNNSYTILRITADMSDKFLVGHTVTGLTSAETGTIVKRNPDLGQIFIDGNKTFINDELIVDDNSNSTTVIASYEEYNAPIHYLDTSNNNEITDINPFSAIIAAELVPYTLTDFFTDKNEELKEIRVIKPNVINGVVGQIKKAFLNS